MVETDLRRTLSRLLDAVSGLLAPRGRRGFAIAAARKRQERGQTLVEFVFAATLILVVLMIIVDFGLAIDRRLVLQHGVREGARTGATGAQVSEIQNATGQQVGIDPAQVLVCYVDTDLDGRWGEVGEDVKVSADVVYRFAAGMNVAAVFDTGIRMTPSSQARLEKSVPVTSPYRC